MNGLHNPHTTRDIILESAILFKNATYQIVTTVVRRTYGALIPDTKNHLQQPSVSLSDMDNITYLAAAVAANAMAGTFAGSLCARSIGNNRVSIAGIQRASSRSFCLLFCSGSVPAPHLLRAATRYLELLRRKRVRNLQQYDLDLMKELW